MPYQDVQHAELIALAKLTGIYAVPGVFRVTTELLALQIPPEDIYALLQQICQVPLQKKINVIRQKSDKIKP